MCQNMMGRASQTLENSPGPELLVVKTHGECLTYLTVGSMLVTILCRFCDFIVDGLRIKVAKLEGNA